MLSKEIGEEGWGYYPEKRSNKTVFSFLLLLLLDLEGIALVIKH